MVGSYRTGARRDRPERRHGSSDITVVSGAGGLGGGCITGGSEVGEGIGGTGGVGLGGRIERSSSWVGGVSLTTGGGGVGVTLSTSSTSSSSCRGWMGCFRKGKTSSLKKTL